MWSWVFGITISTFLLLTEYSVSSYVSFLPFLLLALYGMGDILFSVMNKTLPTNFYSDIVAIVLCIWMVLEIFEVVSFSTLAIGLLISMVCISVVYAYEYLIYAPRLFQVGNVVSMVLNGATYLCIYGVETKSIDSWVPLVPFSAILLLEIILVTVMFRGFDATLDLAYSTEKAVDRLIYSTGIIVIFLIGILHSSGVVPDAFIYWFATIINVLGLLIILTLNGYTCTLNCFTVPYKHLKEEDINMS